jgi:hypothetical protein
MIGTKHKKNKLCKKYFAEGVGFEPTIPFGMAHFKCAGINLYPTPPYSTVWTHGESDPGLVDAIDL